MIDGAANTSTAEGMFQPKTSLAGLIFQFDLLFTTRQNVFIALMQLFITLETEPNLPYNLVMLRLLNNNASLSNVSYSVYTSRIFLSFSILNNAWLLHEVQKSHH